MVCCFYYVLKELVGVDEVVFGFNCIYFGFIRDVCVRYVCIVDVFVVIFDVVGEVFVYELVE